MQSKVLLIWSEPRRMSSEDGKQSRHIATAPGFESIVDFVEVGAHDVCDMSVASVSQLTTEAANGGTGRIRMTGCVICGDATQRTFSSNSMLEGLSTTGSLIS